MLDSCLYGGERAEEWGEGGEVTSEPSVKLKEKPNLLRTCHHLFAYIFQKMSFVQSDTIFSPETKPH